MSKHYMFLFYQCVILKGYFEVVRIQLNWNSENPVHANNSPFFLLLLCQLDINAVVLSNSRLIPRQLKHIAHNIWVSSW